MTRATTPASAARQGRGPDDDDAPTGGLAKVKGKPLPPLAAEIGAATWGQVVLKYLLGNPAITCVIPGTDKASHMADNFAAGRGPVPDAGQRAELVRYSRQWAELRRSAARVSGKPVFFALP